MLNLMVNIRILFYGWLLTNVGLLLYSGYLKKIVLAMSLKNMGEFVNIHKVIFLFQTLNIEYYDITEFIVSYLVAVCIFYFFKRMENSRINYRVIQTY